jgi:hypothetical protein
MRLQLVHDSTFIVQQIWVRKIVSILGHDYTFIVQQMWVGKIVSTLGSLLMFSEGRWKKVKRKFC